MGHDQVNVGWFQACYFDSFQSGVAHFPDGDLKDLATGHRYLVRAIERVAFVDGIDGSPGGDPEQLSELAIGLEA